MVCVSGNENKKKIPKPNSFTTIVHLSFVLFFLNQAWTPSLCMWAMRCLRTTSPSAGAWPTLSPMPSTSPRTWWLFLVGFSSPTYCTGKRYSGKSKRFCDFGLSLAGLNLLKWSELESRGHNRIWTVFEDLYDCSVCMILFLNVLLTCVLYKGHGMIFDMGFLAADLCSISCDSGSTGTKIDWYIGNISMMTVRVYLCFPQH